MLGPLRAPPSGAALTPPATDIPPCPAGALPQEWGSLPSAKGMSWGRAEVCALYGPGRLSPHCPLRGPKLDHHWTRGRRVESSEPPVFVGVLLITL